MHYKIRSFIVLMTVLLFASTGVLAEDDRQLIKVDATLKASVLKEMRELTERLDDVLAALSEGDFKQVARLGEIHLGFGHSKLEAMLAQGASEAEIQARRARMKKNRAAREKSGESGHQAKGSMFGLSNSSKGLGQKLPKDFWLMGQAMHGAAEEMALAARAVGDKPTVNDYKAVTGKLQEMTTACRGCHSAFRLP